MTLVLVTVVLVCAAMLAYDHWEHHRPAPGRVYDWELDLPLARLFEHEQQADEAWTRFFDQHGVLIFPKEAS